MMSKMEEHWRGGDHPTGLVPGEMDGAEGTPRVLPCRPQPCFLSLGFSRLRLGGPRVCFAPALASVRATGM